MIFLELAERSAADNVNHVTKAIKLEINKTIK